jgi:membrane AbrB-like protein
MIVAAALTASGSLSGHMPASLFAAGQLAIGYVLGCRFNRAIIRKLPTVTAAGLLCTVLLSGLMAGYGVGLAALTELEFATAALATSPGGMAEMATTAQVLNLNVSIVVAFHFVRAVLVNGFATYYWALLERLGFFRAMERVLGS